MPRQFYFPNIIRKANVSFLSMFKDIQVAKYDASGNILTMRNVPIIFGHKQKFLARMLKDQKKNYNAYLPRMAASIKGIARNSDKNRGGYLTPLFEYINTNTGGLEKLFAGSPYRIDYTLSVVSLHMSEVSQILEQILPEFNPYRNVTIKEFDFLPNFTRDLKVMLEDSIAPQFIESYNEIDEIPRIEVDIPFSVDCWIYRPLLTTDIIKTIGIELIDASVLQDGTNGTNLVDSYAYQVSGGDVDNFSVITDQWTPEV